MASTVPIARQVGWLSSIPHLLVLGACLWPFYLAGTPHFMLYGAALYLGLSLALRNFVANAHRRGIRLVRQQQFARAIPFFAQSAAFFARHAWVDRYRYLVMLSSSRVSYREMALCNLAFCYTQTGDAQRARATYEQALQEFPGSALAQTSLNLIRTFEQPAPASHPA